MQTQTLSLNKNNQTVETRYRNKPQTFFAPIHIQPKLEINTPDDPFEREADAMAEKVMRMTVPSNNRRPFFNPASNVIHRKCAHCEEEEKLQRKTHIEEGILNVKAGK